MTPGQYLSSIINKYRINVNGIETQVNLLYPIIERWGGQNILEVIYSGSIAKGTAISLGTDADLFISLSSSTEENLADIYNTLYNAVNAAGYHARKQNVSIGVRAGVYQIDLVPGKRQSQYGYDHSLYRNKAKTWTKTNVKTHVSHVSGCNRINEIVLTKIWRQLNSIDFPSFYLELAVIECLSGRPYYDLNNNFWEVLGFLSGDFINRRYIDPANSNNVISADLSTSEKQKIKDVALIARTKKTWREIVW